jgi:hypothetical protein
MRTLIPSLIAAAVAAEVSYLCRHRLNMNRWVGHAVGIVAGGAAAMFVALFTER